MSDRSIESVRNEIDAVYRSKSRRVFATLIRLVGDFNLAEEALQDAFTAALEHWPAKGVPANPRARLVSAGRFKAVDAMRRRERLETRIDQFTHVAALWSILCSRPLQRCTPRHSGQSTQIGHIAALKEPARRFLEKRLRELAE